MGFQWPSWATYIILGVTLAIAIGLLVTAWVRSSRERRRAEDRLRQAQGNACKAKREANKLASEVLVLGFTESDIERQFLWDLPEELRNEYHLKITNIRNRAQELEDQLECLNQDPAKDPAQSYDEVTYAQITGLYQVVTQGLNKYNGKLVRRIDDINIVVEKYSFGALKRRFEALKLEAGQMLARFNRYASYFPASHEMSRVMNVMMSDKEIADNIRYERHATRTYLLLGVMEEGMNELRELILTLDTVVRVLSDVRLHMYDSIDRAHTRLSSFKLVTDVSEAERLLEALRLSVEERAERYNPSRVWVDQIREVKAFDDEVDSIVAAVFASHRQGYFRSRTSEDTASQYLTRVKRQRLS